VRDGGGAWGIAAVEAIDVRSTPVPAESSGLQSIPFRNPRGSASNLRGNVQGGFAFQVGRDFCDSPYGRRGSRRAGSNAPGSAVQRYAGYKAGRRFTVSSGLSMVAGNPSSGHGCKHLTITDGTSSLGIV